MSSNLNKAAAALTVAAAFAANAAPAANTPCPSAQPSTTERYARMAGGIAGTVVGSLVQKEASQASRGSVPGAAGNQVARQAGAAAATGTRDVIAGGVGMVTRKGDCPTPVDTPASAVTPETSPASASNAASSPERPASAASESGGSLKSWFKERKAEGRAFIKSIPAASAPIAPITDENRPN